MKTYRIEPPGTFLAYARRLLEIGADPKDRIEFWRGDVLCLSGPIWAAAKLTVHEEGGSGAPKFARWKPFPHRRSDR